MDKQELIESIKTTLASMEQSVIDPHSAVGDLYMQLLGELEQLEQDER